MCACVSCVCVPATAKQLPVFNMQQKKAQQQHLQQQQQYAYHQQMQQQHQQYMEHEHQAAAGMFRLHAVGIRCCVVCLAVPSCAQQQHTVSVCLHTVKQLPVCGDAALELSGG